MDNPSVFTLCIAIDGQYHEWGSGNASRLARSLELFIHKMSGHSKEKGCPVITRTLILLQYGSLSLIS